MNQQEFEQWKETFFALATAELDHLVRLKSENERIWFKETVKVARKYIRTVTKTVVHPPYGKVRKIIGEYHIEKILNILQVMSRKVEKLRMQHKAKKYRPGPKTWPKGVKKMVIEALELSKRNIDSLERIRHFLCPNGEIDEWLKRHGYENLLSVSHLNMNSESKTQWANNLKTILIRSYILENHRDVKNEKSAKFKRYKKEFLTSLVREP